MTPGPSVMTARSGYLWEIVDHENQITAFFYQNKLILFSLRFLEEKKRFFVAYLCFASTS